MAVGEGKRVAADFMEKRAPDNSSFHAKSEKMGMMGKEMSDKGGSMPEGRSALKKGFD